MSIKDLNWFVKDKKAVNAAMIIKAVGKKFNDEELKTIYDFFINIKYVQSVYIRNGYLDIYFNHMKFYPDIYNLKNDGYL